MRRSLAFALSLLPVAFARPALSQATLVRDINTLPDGGATVNSEDFVAVGSRVYFTDGADTLWYVDDPAVGAQLLFGLSSPFFIEELTAFDGALWFQAYTQDSGSELWRTDGTYEGTQAFVDLFPGTESSTPTSLRVAGGYLWFGADDGVHGRELWRTDGQSVELVADIVPGAEGSDPVLMGELSGGRVLFAAETPGAGREPWVSDGVATVQVADLGAGDSLFPDQWPTLFELEPVAAFGGVCFVALVDGLQGVWFSDGTEAGTYPLAASVLDLRYLTAAGNHVFFAAAGSSRRSSTPPTGRPTARGRSSPRELRSDSQADPVVCCISPPKVQPGASLGRATERSRGLSSCSTPTERARAGLSWIPRSTRCRTG